VIPERGLIARPVFGVSGHCARRNTVSGVANAALPHFTATCWEAAAGIGPFAVTCWATVASTRMWPFPLAGRSLD
jgi:hypothetical protein